MTHQDTLNGDMVGRTAVKKKRGTKITLFNSIEQPFKFCLRKLYFRSHQE